METVIATFSIPDWIDKGLKNQTYERVGGIIRDSQTKHIVAWLCEAAPTLTQTPTILSQFGSVASILNLGVSVIGFTIVIKRLGEIEQRLKLIQKDVKQLNHKFDLSVYANFRAALDLVRDAFTMTKHENRANMVNLAINRFLEAQHIYTSYFEAALEEDIQVADEYLSSLFLTYVAKTRCYLELEEIETARLCLQEGTNFLCKSVKKFVEKVFLYLDQEEQEKFYKNHSLLIPPTYITINDVITGVLGGWTTIKPKVEPLFPKISMAAHILPVLPLGNLLGELLGINSEEDEDEELKLTQPLERIESMIETFHRFEAYQAEIQLIYKQGISFDDWLQLTLLPEVKFDQTGCIYCIPSKPLDLQLCNNSIFTYS